MYRGDDLPAMPVVMVVNLLTKNSVVQPINLSVLLPTSIEKNKITRQRRDDLPALPVVMVGNLLTKNSVVVVQPINLSVPLPTSIEKTLFDESESSEIVTRNTNTNDS